MSQSVAKSVNSTKSGTKRFTNGHVCFVAAQQKAFQELLKKEFDKKERFDRLKTELKMPRNPLVGEATPREGEGRPLLNDFWLESASTSKQQSKPKDVTLKIGVDDKKYQFLGNSLTRQGSRPQLVSAGLASLGAPPSATARVQRQALDQTEIDPDAQRGYPQPELTPSPQSIGRSKPQTPATSLEEANAVARGGTKDGRNSRNDWESQGTPFYFRIVE